MRVLFEQSTQGATRRTILGALGLGLLALPVLAGCLVTEQVDYSAPNMPPIVGRVRPEAATWILPTPGDTSCGPDQVGFVASVTDYDVNDSLEATLVVNGQRITGFGIPITNRENRGEIRLCVLRSTFMRPCSFVEFLVSSGYSAIGEPYGTQIPGDLGRTDWTVVGAANPNSADATQSDCGPVIDVDAGSDDGGADAGVLDSGP